MKNLIQTKIPNVYAVKVPIEESYKAVYYVNDNQTLIYKSGYPFLTLDGNFNLLGYITKSEISFDASEVVESQDFSDMDYDGNWIEITRYWDYEYKQFSAMDSDESFRSALPEEIVWENPCNIPIEPVASDYFDVNKRANEFNDEDMEGLSKHYNSLCYYEDALKKWQSAQEQITEKLLILNKV